MAGTASPIKCCSSLTRGGSSNPYAARNPCAQPLVGHMACLGATKGF